MPYVGTPHEYLNYTRLAYDKFSGIVMNGQTLDMSRSYPRGSFQDIFGWIKYATPGGDVVYNQTTCQAWSLYAPAIFEAGFASEDVAKGGCPGLPGPGRR